MDPIDLDYERAYAEHMSPPEVRPAMLRMVDEITRLRADLAQLHANVASLMEENARLREEVVRLQDLVNCDCDSETRKALDRANMGRTLDLAETIRLSAENARLREAMPTLKELYALVRVCDQWIPSHVRHDEKTLRGWLARLDAAKGVR